MVAAAKISGSADHLRWLSMDSAAATQQIWREEDEGHLSRECSGVPGRPRVAVLPPDCEPRTSNLDNHYAIRRHWSHVFGDKITAGPTLRHRSSAPGRRRKPLLDDSRQPTGLGGGLLAGSLGRQFRTTRWRD